MSEKSDLTILLVPLALYMLPAIIAFARQHHQKIAILLLNALLGWTVLGWIAALIWAATYTPGRQSRPGS